MNPLLFTRIAKETIYFSGVTPLRGPELNKPGFKLFSDAIQLIKTCKCPLCKHDIEPDSIRSAQKYMIEYNVSGLCHTCTDNR